MAQSIDLGSAHGVIELKADVDRAASRFNSALSGMASTAGGMLIGGIAQTAITAVVSGLGGMASEAWNTAVDFESAMAVMSTAIDPAQLGLSTTAEAMAVMKDAALAVGGDTALIGVSASSAADSITGLSKAGLSATEIFGDLEGYLAGTAELGGALRASVDMAAASELDMVQASQLAAITLNTFGGGLETAEERAEFVNAALNNFVQTADSSATSVSGLADALTNVGPTAAQFGFSLEETNAALAMLADRGIQGSEAGTALKSMMTNIMRDTPDVTGALSDLNVELYNTDGTMKSLPDIMTQFAQGLEGMTEEQRNQYIQTVAGTYGMKAMASLLAEGEDGWANMAAAVGDAATIQEVAAARTNTFAGRMEAFQGVMETLKIQIGDALLPVITPLIEKFAALAETYGPMLTSFFAGLVGTVTNLVAVISGEGFAGLFTVFEDGSSVMGSLFEKLGMGETAAAGLSAWLGEIVNAFIAFIAPIAEWVAQIVSLQDVLVALGLGVASVVIPAIWGIITAMAPIIATVGAVILAVALLRQAWETNFLGIRDKVQQVIDWLRPLILGFITAIQQWWAANGQAIMTSVQTAWTAIQTGVTVVVETLWTLIEGLVTQIQAWWEENGEAVKTAVSTAWAAIQATVETVIEVIQRVVGAFQKAFRGDWEGFGRDLGELWSEAWDAITDFLETVWPRILAWLGTLWDNFVTWFTSTDWAGLARKIIDGLISGLQAGWGAVADAVYGFIHGVIGTADEALDTGSPSREFAQRGIWIAEGLAQGIQAGEQTVFRTMTDLLDKLMGLGRGFAGVFGDTFVDPLRDANGQARDQIGTIDDAISGLWAGIADRAPDTADLFGDITRLDTGSAIYQLHKLINDPDTPGWLAGRARTMIEALEERRRLEQGILENNEAIAEAQQRQLEIEEKRKQLDFLKMQQDLLDMIRENGLDADQILDGLTLGLDADAGGLMDAMAAAMSEMIAAAEDELGIASPSKVAQGLADNFIRSFAGRLGDAGQLVSAMRNSLDRATTAAGQVITNNHALVNYGGMTINQPSPYANYLTELYRMAQ